MKRFITIKTSFVGFHRWKDAPNICSFLRNWHRHIFYVKMIAEVSHNEREIEFITLKKDLDEYIHLNFDYEYFEYSCETLAEKILLAFNAHTVCVSEDDENGAIVINDGNNEDYQLYSCRGKS